MARLLIVEGTDGPREIQLQPGINRLGRIIEDNHFQVPDASVSSHHCEVEWSEGVVTVRDLGSTNGTFLNDQPIQEATLAPGHKLRLGTVEMIFQGQDAPAVPPADGPPLPLPLPTVPAAPRVVARVTGRVAQGTQEAKAAVPPGAEVCRNHPNVPALWRCVKCDFLSCKACVKTMMAGMREFHSCPACGSSCMSVAEYKRLASDGKVGFFQLLPGAFSYPLKKDGLILLIVGTVLFGALDGVRQLLSHVPMMGMVGLAYWLSLIMGIGYMFASMQNIVVSSSDNEDALPDWPEIANFWDCMLQPFLRFGIIWAVCLGPGLATALFVSPFLGIPLLVVGLVCLPMAILAVSMADGLGGLNPIILFSGIGKMPGPYLATCAVFLVVFAVVGGINLLLELTGIPVVPIFITTFFSLYGLCVEMRLLGLLYFTNKRKLAWYH